MNATNWTTNAALFGLVLILSVLTYQTQKQSIVSNTKPPLTPLTIDNVETITINKRGAKTVLQKINKLWQVVKPIKIKANQFRIGSLLKLLTTNDYEKYEASTLDLSQYGLTNSSLTVTINTTNIIFGNVNPVNAKRYMLINDNLYILADNFFPLVNSQLGTLVDQKLFNGNAVITHIKSSNLDIHKNSLGIWSSDNTHSTDSIIEFINHWETAQAFGVHTYVKRETIEKIEITLNNNVTPIQYIVTDKDPWLIIARPDLNIEYHFDDNMISKLLSIEPLNLPDK